jgi:putative SOS response-associated peptidase YedK
MSDRLARHSDQEEIEQQFEATTHRKDFFDPDYNISPGSLLPAVFIEDNERKIENFQWGLIPADAEAEDEGKDFYRTSIEDIEGDDWLRECLGQRRCIVPINGFYKWKTTEKKSTPFYVRLLSNRVAGLAAIYSVWEADSGRKVYSFSLLTIEANALVQPVDDHMPAILRHQDYATWLDSQINDLKQLKTLLKPLGITEMAVNRVSEEVSDLTASGPELIQPIPK